MATAGKEKEKVIYTDGRDVTVTDSILKVKNTSYNISGITRLGLWTIKPHRWPVILTMLVGIALAVCGFMRLIPEQFSFETNNGIIAANTLAIWIGIALTIIGFLILLMMHDRYAVRIETAEGEKNAIVSSKREYIAQIVDALNTAFHFDQPHTDYLAKE